MIIKKTGKKKQPPKLSDAQVQHALARLTQVYNTAINRMVQVVMSRPEPTLNWRDPVAVAAFVTKYNLPSIGWAELGEYVFGGGDLPSGLYERVRAAIAREREGGVPKVDNLRNTLTAELASVQDRIVFNQVEVNQVAGLIKAFFEKTEALLNQARTSTGSPTAVACGTASDQTSPDNPGTVSDGALPVVWTYNPPAINTSLEDMPTMAPPTQPWYPPARDLTMAAGYASSVTGRSTVG